MYFWWQIIFIYRFKMSIFTKNLFRDFYFNIYPRYTSGCRYWFVASRGWYCVYSLVWIFIIIIIIIIVIIIIIRYYSLIFVVLLFGTNKRGIYFWIIYDWFAIKTLSIHLGKGNTDSILFPTEINKKIGIWPVMFKSQKFRL